jgi:biopolymer transport protein ExbD
LNRILVPMLVSFCVFVTGFANAETPTSKPTSRPVTARPPAKRPAPTIRVSMDAQGTLVIDGQQKAFSESVLLVLGWKRQVPKPRVELTLAERAPARQAQAVQALLRDAGISFVIKWNTSSAPVVSRPVVRPPAARKVVAQRPAPRAAAQKPATPGQKTHGSIVWTKVPVTSARGAKQARQKVEIRGLLRKADLKPSKFAVLALIRYANKKRRPIAFLRANAKGLFRFVFAPKASESYRISVLEDRRVFEFPVSWQGRGAILYTRLTMTDGKKPVRRVVAPPARRFVLKKQQPVRRRVVPSRPAPPAKTKEKATACQWSKVPRVKTKRAPKARRVALRLQVVGEGSTKAGFVATGLIRRIGKKRVPLSRGQTNGNGCIVYVVDVLPKGTYEMAVLHGASLKMAPVKDLKKVKAHTFVRVVLQTKKRKATLFEGLHIFFEPLNLDWLLVKQIAYIFYAPQSPNQKVAYTLPMPKGAVRVQLGRNLSALRPRLSKGKGLVLNRLRPGRNQLLYGYLLPRNADAETAFSLPFSHRVERVFAFFSKGQVRPSKGGENAKTITRGKGKQKRTFLVMSFPASAPNQNLNVTVAPTKPPPSGVIGWMGRMKRKRKQNKLLGLGVLLTISCLGLFWLLSVPRRRAET